MQLVEDIQSTLNDIWGFPAVWLPFGKPGLVENVRTNYMVTGESIQNPDSVETIVGTPIYIWHPADQVNFNNFGKYLSVGVCTDKYRWTADGGGEILAKITDNDCYQQILSGQLTEVSPAYAVNDKGVRIYNHLALLPTGYARGGRKMQIKLEGNNDGNNQSSLSDEIYSIDINQQQQHLEGNAVTNNIMEQTLGQILAAVTDNGSKYDSLSAQLSSIQQMMIADAANDAMEVEGKSMCVEGEDPTLTFYKEGYEQGLAAGEIISTAKNYGYVVEGQPNVEEAKTYCVTKAFPDIKVEGFSKDMLHGVYTGALNVLGKFKEVAPALVTVEAEVVPSISVENNIKKPISRFKLV